MPPSSATGGYLTPSSSQALPGSLTLTQFIQSVIVGISGYGGTLVRPKWQVNPPKSPDITVNWIAFGITVNNSDFNAWVGFASSDATASTLARQEDLEIQVAFYGPNAQENIAAFRDGFQIQQNLEAMRLANMGYRGAGQMIHGPDLINERWCERYEMTIFLTRQVQRTYQVLSFASVEGTIHTVVNGDDLSIQFEATEDT